MADGTVSYSITASGAGFGSAFAGVRSVVGQTTAQLRGLSGSLS